MEPERHNPVTVMEQYQVSPWPSPSAGKPRSLPLTFYDIAFWDVPQVQRLFFYDNADLLGAAEFLHRELPLFEQSLAAALHHFYPLAGKLPCGMPEAAAPKIVFSEGDSVRLTVAVGDDNFEDLVGDDPRDTARLRALLPPLLKHGGGGGSQCSQDVFAIQLTVFPRAGICVGTTLHHAVCDGSSYVHFMRTWAAIYRRGLLGCDGGKPMALDTPPLFDRSVVRDDEGLREAFLRDHRAYAAAGDERLHDCDLTGGTTELATFRFTDRLLGRLGRQVESETSARRCSPYALACGAMWAGIVHARGSGASFGFVTGCKPRASPPIPASYFGNCLGLCRVEEEMEAKQRQSCLAAVAASAAAIWRAIEGLAEQGRVLRDAPRWVRLVREYASARAVTVAGSPKLGLYAATDLGPPWGRPRKVEIVSVERTGALALAESGRDGDGGVEVGLALPRGEMEAFRVFYGELVIAAA